MGRRPGRYRSRRRCPYCRAMLLRDRARSLNREIRNAQPGIELVAGLSGEMRGWIGQASMQRVQVLAYGHGVVRGRLSRWSAIRQQEVRTPLLIDQAGVFCRSSRVRPGVRKRVRAAALYRRRPSIQIPRIRSAWPQLFETAADDRVISSPLRSERCRVCRSSPYASPRIRPSGCPASRSFGSERTVGPVIPGQVAHFAGEGHAPSNLENGRSPGAAQTTSARATPASLNPTSAAN